MRTSNGCEEYQEGWLLRVGAQTQVTYSTTSYSTASGPWRCMLKNRHLDTHMCTSLTHFLQLVCNHCHQTTQYPVSNTVPQHAKCAT